MIPVELLWAVLITAAVVLVAVVWVEQVRINEERRHADRLRERIAVDEELLERLRGPRHSPDPDDWRRA